MRDQAEIHREIFHARQDLERNLDHLVHDIRAKLAVRARATRAVTQAIGNHQTTIAAVAIGLIAIGLVLALLRRR
jgi:hypothetical protein